MKYIAILLTIATVEAMNLKVSDDESELVTDMEQIDVDDV